MKRSYQKWTDAEKDDLVQLVKQQKNNGAQISWIKIANTLIGKTPRQCYDQWLQLQKVSDNLVIKTKWKDTDVTLLCDAVEKHGQDWDQIQSMYFPQYASEKLQQKYKSVQRQKKKGIQSIESMSSSCSFLSETNSVQQSNVKQPNQYQQVQQPQCQQVYQQNIILPQQKQCQDLFQFQPDMNMYQMNQNAQFDYNFTNQLPKQQTHQDEPKHSGDFNIMDFDNSFQM